MNPFDDFNATEPKASCQQDKGGVEVIEQSVDVSKLGASNSAPKGTLQTSGLMTGTTSMAAESCSILEQDIPMLQGKRREPAYTNQSEQYHHRVIALLKAQGQSNVEVAAAMEMSSVTINYLVKQPFMEKMILETIHKVGGDQVAMFFQSQAYPAAQLLSTVISDPDAANRDRIAAANAILDRVYGKPNQPVTSHKGRDMSKCSDEELAAIVAGVPLTKTA